jgi:hypothetical protein
LKTAFFILFFLLNTTILKVVDAQTQPDFKWGNAFYFNINIGETITFKNVTIKLIEQKKQFNRFVFNNDTVWIKVSRRTLPVVVGEVRVFVADNRNVKALTSDKKTHGLLKKGALICLSGFNEPLLDPNEFYFPISYNDGFLWSVEENSTMFAYQSEMDKKEMSHAGVDFDLHNVRGLKKHWIVAIENSTVMWVEKESLNGSQMAVCALARSDSHFGIYYVYNYMCRKNIEIKKGDKLIRGEPIGTAWGDKNWGHLQFSVIKSDTVPTINSKYFNVVNCFPQFFSLYHKHTLNINRYFTKGIIKFGEPACINGNRKNVIAFEEFAGKGWLIGDWNCADRVEWANSKNIGNARLWKVLFKKERAECTNPENYYEFEINVKNGVYRIRAKVGDAKLATWQKVSFENVVAETYSLNVGQYKWTSERVVKVKDGKLTVRIYIAEKENKPAGISEIVFQRAY